VADGAAGQMQFVGGRASRRCRDGRKLSRGARSACVDGIRKRPQVNRILHEPGENIFTFLGGAPSLLCLADGENP